MKARRGGKALILIGHGSRAAGFDAAMKKVAAGIKRSKKYTFVRCAFLEISLPSVPDAVRECSRRGVSEVRLLPYFLLKGRHTQEDIPALATAARDEHPGLRIVLCPYLGYGEELFSLVLRRAGETAR